MENTIYRVCGNPACRRKVGGSARYCCAGCSVAHEGKYDPDGYHSDGCDDRARERGEWKFGEML